MAVQTIITTTFLRLAELVLVLTLSSVVVIILTKYVVLRWYQEWTKQ